MLVLPAIDKLRNSFVNVIPTVKFVAYTNEEINRNDI